MGNLFSQSNETDEQIFDREYQKYRPYIPQEDTIEILQTKTNSLIQNSPKQINHLLERLNLQEIVNCISGKGPCSAMAKVYRNFYKNIHNWYLLCDYKTINGKFHLNAILNFPNKYKTKALLVLDYILLLRDNLYQYTTNKIENGVEVSLQANSEEGLYYLLELIMYLQLFDIEEYQKDYLHLTIDGTYVSGPKDVESDDSQDWIRKLKTRVKRKTRRED